MPRNMMCPVPQAEWSGGEMEKIWEVLRLPESVILLREMADVSPF